MNNFLRTQGNYVLQNPLYAYFLAAILAFTPFIGWLSLTIVTLVALRKNYYDSFKVFLVGFSASIIANSWHHELPFDTVGLIATYVMGYGAALLLRIKHDWKIVISTVVTLGLGIIVSVHTFFPEFIHTQFQLLLGIFHSLAKNAPLVHLIDAQNAANQMLLANYLLGVQVSSVVLSALFSLMLARQIQSLLYYPGGFRQELLAFRANRIGVIALFISAVGAYQNVAIAVSFLPITLLYVMSAGMIVLFQILSRKKDCLTMLFLFVPLILAPYVMLPMYVLLGSLDSLFNFRPRLPSTGK